MPSAFVLFGLVGTVLSFIKPVRLVFLGVLALYLLLDLGRAQAWRPSAGPGQPTWLAMLPNPLATLQALAEGRARHADAGACPTAAAPTARDPGCRVCQALEALGLSAPAVRSAA